MASNFLHQAQRGASRGSIDLPLALLAGLSIGFVGFMLPSDILSRIVETSRLPEILPAAAPPLGAKARIALAVAAGGGTFAAVWLLLRMLGRKPPEPKARAWADLDVEPETPRLRRSDVHPDAPARRPILAARELGEPAPAPAPEPAPAEAEAAPPELPAEELELAGPGIEILPEEPVAADRVAEETVAEEPVLPDPFVADPASPPAQPEPNGGESIAELMTRLERGLARRRQRGSVVTSPAPAVPAPAPAAEQWGDDRLRSAIENLQKIAARAG